MYQDLIHKKVKKLVKIYGTRDPFEICRLLGIKVVFADLGSLKGMYTIYKKNRVIIINSSLDEYMQILICAHELGHDLFHQHLAKNKCFREFMLYDMKSRPEFEANLVAAELLIPDNNILDLIYSNYDVEQISCILNIDINLVAIKVSTLNTRGYKFNNSFVAKSDFLGK